MMVKFNFFQNIMRVFSSLILLLSFQFCFACGGWDLPSETIRLGMFNAQRTNFFPGLSRFYYSADSYYKEFRDFDTDSKLNCLEWKEKLRNNINPDDVYIILYKTSPATFVASYEARTLHKVFKNNTFIKTLLLPKNKAFLDYILVAKKQESLNGWYNNYVVDIDECKRKIKQTKDFFLKQRYAFIVLREYHGCDNIEEENYLYNTYFKNKKTILDHSAMFYYAVYPENGDTLRNYLLSKIFMKCGDKAFKTYRQYDSSLNEATLALAKNNEEKSNILGMQYLQYPSKCLKGIKNIAKLSPNNSLLSFLIRREVNKLEDWILTPIYTNQAPGVAFDFYDTWYEDYEKAKKENYAKDILYLRELRQFLISFYDKTSGEQKDYVAAAIAQLCFIDEEVNLGKRYTNLISSNANVSIQVQKNIQLALVTLKKNDLKNKEVQQQLYKYFNSIENLNKKDDALPKTLYSLYRIASKEFSKQGNEALAGLFFIKAESWKTIEDDDVELNLSYYDYLGYLERHATIEERYRLFDCNASETK